MPGFWRSLLDGVGVEEAVARAVDHHQGARRDQCGEIRKIEVVKQSRDMEGQADGIDDVPPDLLRERRHPANVHGGLDPRRERGQHETAVTAHGKADTAEPARVDLRPASEIVESAEVVPEEDARPGDPGGEETARDQLLGLRGPAIERVNVALREESERSRRPSGSPAYWRRRSPQ